MEKKINKNELRDSLHTTSSNSLRSQELVITKEMLQKAMQCENADELLKLAEAEGYDVTKEEAEAYMAELADFELDGEQLKNVAGGGCYTKCDSDTCDKDWAFDVL